METILTICIFGAFGLGWVLGYYNIPNLKLSEKDAMQDYLQEHPSAKLTHKSEEDS